MNGPRHERPDRRSERDATAEARIEEAVARIEQAARDLSLSATDRAAAYIEDVADRISSARRRARHESKRTGPGRSGRLRTRELYRDRDRRMLLGVCSGIANYYGIEAWVVRLLVLTGLLFLTGPTFLVYLVLAVLMPKAPLDRFDYERPSRRRHRERDHGRRRRRRRRRSRGRGGWAEDQVWIPRHRLRDVRADFEQMELKLRRIETHVTSGNYQPHRDLAELERRDGGSPTSRSG